MAASNLQPPLKTVVSEKIWSSLLDDCVISKEDMNKLVMNYLVIEGFKEAAENFSYETGLKPDVDLRSIENRMNIRTAIQIGNISDAIDKVNDLDPEILDRNPCLYFRLLQQKFIEMIRENKISDALAFAQDELAPLGEQNPEILEDLEKTMTLLAFESINDSPVSTLLDLSQRLLTASEVNAAILHAQCQTQESRLPNLLKLLSWSQELLAEKIQFPMIQDFSTAIPTMPVTANNSESMTYSQSASQADVEMSNA